MRSCIFLQGFCVFLFSAFLTNRNKPPIFKQMHSKKEFRYPDDSLFLLLQPSMDAVLHTSYTFGAWFPACSGLNASISQLATGSEGISKCVLGVLDIQPIRRTQELNNQSPVSNGLCGPQVAMLPCGLRYLVNGSGLGLLSQPCTSIWATRQYEYPSGHFVPDGWPVMHRWDMEELACLVNSTH